MKYEKACYTAPFLKEAIIRIDFPAAVPCLTDTLDTKISKASLSKFPIFEPQKLQTQEFQFLGAGFSANSREVTQWTFHGKNREKTLIISPESVIQTTKSYKSYEAFSGDFHHIVNAISDVQNDIPVNRIGIRYVNVIDINNGNPLEWFEYINESMLGIIDLNKDRSESVSRAFHILEYNFDEINLKFQFGIANPDYPSVIKRKQFVLDLDAYSQGALELSEVNSILGKAHALIQEFFELSITDKTRNQMKPKKNESK